MEVTGKRRNNGIPASYAFYRKRPSKIKNLIQLIRGKRIKRICGICRCVDSVSVLKDFDSCLSVSNLSFVKCEHLFVISGLLYVRDLDCARYDEDFVVSWFVISRSCPVHFTVTLIWRKSIVRSTGDFVIETFVKSTVAQ